MFLHAFLHVVGKHCGLIAFSKDFHRATLVTVALHLTYISFDWGDLYSIKIFSPKDYEKYQSFSDRKATELTRLKDSGWKNIADTVFLKRRGYKNQIMTSKQKRS